MIASVLDHLWQSTLFVAAAVFLTLFLKPNRAGVRYRLWLAASLKFLFPLALLTEAGRVLSQALLSPLLAPRLIQTLGGATDPFSDGVSFTMPASASWHWGPVLMATWLLGTAVVCVVWARQWLGLRKIVRMAAPSPIEAPLPALTSPFQLEPGLVGVWSPVLLLPGGIEAQLSPDELDAIIAHEVCHWRRRDNFTAALHMAVEAIFWFYPLVWWLETRLIAERERACDEGVVAAGRDPTIYAESILKVCKFYVQSPLACASGVSGADLKKRMEEIMWNSVKVALSLPKKLMLAAAGITALAIPILVGCTTPPSVQTPADTAATNGPNSAEEEAQLRQILDGIHAGNPPYAIMSPDAAGILRQQWTEAFHISKDMGVLQSLTVQDLSHAFDEYTAVYEHGQAKWVVSPLENGKMDKIIIDAIRITGQPRAGTEGAARRYVEGMESGKPNYDEMTPDMASRERQMSAHISAQLKPWGALKSLSYEYRTLLGPAGNRRTSRFAPPESLDVYRVEFENHATDVAIDLDASGKIVMCIIRNG